MSDDDRLSIGLGIAASVLTKGFVAALLLAVSADTSPTERTDTATALSDSDVLRALLVFGMNHRYDKRGKGVSVSHNGPLLIYHGVMSGAEAAELGCEVSGMAMHDDTRREQLVEEFTHFTFAGMGVECPF